LFQLDGSTRLTRPIALMLAVSFLAPAASATARRAPKRPKAVCGVPSGAKVVAQDSQYRIAAVNRPRSKLDVHREWRYCLRRKGQRFHVLVDAAAYVGGLGDLVDVGTVVLAGHYVAFDTETTHSGGRYGNDPEGALTIRNLGTGRTRSSAVTPTGTFCSSTVDSFCVVGPSSYYSCSEGTSCPAEAPMLVLSPDGVAAWDVEQKCVDAATHQWTPCAWGIQVLDGLTGWSRVVDTVPFVSDQYPPNPFSGLQIASCVAGCTLPRQDLVSWNRTGGRFFAAVQ
jgi:hypothetical protein